MSLAFHIGPSEFPSQMEYRMSKVSRDMIDVTQDPLINLVRSIPTLRSVSFIIIRSVCY